MQRQEAAAPDLCGTEELMTGAQKLRHLISEKGWGLCAAACDVTEGVPSMAYFTSHIWVVGEGVK